MPYAVDVDLMKAKSDDPNAKTLLSMDMAKPPVKQIPHLEFPRVVYKWPNEAYRIEIHRNAKHEVVDEERIPAEHLAKSVADEKELKAALKDGWVKEPYVPGAPINPNEGLYDSPEAQA